MLTETDTRIIIVDDQKSMADGLKSRGELIGFDDIVVCYDADEAIQHFLDLPKGKKIHVICDGLEGRFQEVHEALNQTGREGVEFILFSSNEGYVAGAAEKGIQAVIKNIEADYNDLFPNQK
jgi:hypothetical protein